jgi:DNA-binding MarR family transcriptional regulator
VNEITHPDMFVRVKSPAYLLHMNAKLIGLRAERLFGDRKLTLTQRIALMLIELEVATSPGAIANKLGHNAGATTRTINQLEALDLLTRHREAGDRRVVTLTLTPEGSRIAREFHRMLGELNRRILDNLESSEVQALIFLMKRLVTALEAMPLSPLISGRRSL